MKKMNEQATKVFCRLLAKLDANHYAKLHAEGFMPLTMEMVGENIGTAFGTAKLYSLAHYYEQNGDLMRDPEMLFIVVDNRKEVNDYENIFIFPQMYQHDNLGLYEESVCIEAAKITGYKKHWYDGHLSFANNWLKNIRQQGFLI